MEKSETGQDGFSLIEVAISLVVIGLILGGIFKGQELMERARLHKTISQITDYQIAVTTFLEQYNALPGDFGLGRVTFGSESFNGNQNGMIEGYGLEKNSEAIGFWQHLFLAGLIPDPGMHVSQGIYAHFGQGAPKASVGGGFTVESNPTSDLKGNWIILGQENGNRGNGPLLTPAQAMVIDQKLDNGHPLTGRIRVKEGAGITPGRCVNQGRYALQEKAPNCVVYISLQF